MSCLKTRRAAVFVPPVARGASAFCTAETWVGAGGGTSAGRGVGRHCACVHPLHCGALVVHFGAGVHCSGDTEQCVQGQGLGPCSVPRSRQRSGRAGTWLRPSTAKELHGRLFCLHEEHGSGSSGCGLLQRADTRAGWGASTSLLPLALRSLCHPAPCFTAA